MTDQAEGGRRPEPLTLLLEALVRLANGASQSVTGALLWLAVKQENLRQRRLSRLGRGLAGLPEDRMGG